MLCIPSVEALLPPMLPVRSRTGTMTHSVIVEVPIGLATGRPGLNLLGDSLPTTPYPIAFSPHAWGFTPSSPAAVQGGRDSPVASSHGEKTGMGDKIDRCSTWGYWDRLSTYLTRFESSLSRKTNETERRSKKFSDGVFTR